MTGSEQENYARNRQRATELEQRKAQIRALNDQFRQQMAGGLVTITSGVEALGLITLTDVLHRVRTFDQFTPDNDPHEEHDFGSLEAGRHRIFWKIDCYDKAMEYGSPDPTDPAVTMRVMTIMLASEY